MFLPRTLTSRWVDVSQQFQMMKGVLRAAAVERHRMPRSCPISSLGLTPDRRAVETALHVASDCEGHPPALPRLAKTSHVREYLFVSLFRACAESLASENASRLAAMQRAEKNIDELVEDLSGTSHRLRQSGIDEELFDVISGFEALSVEEK